MGRLSWRVAHPSAKFCSCWYYDTASHHSICFPLSSRNKTCVELFTFYVLRTLPENHWNHVVLKTWSTTQIKKSMDDRNHAHGIASTGARACARTHALSLSLFLSLSMKPKFFILWRQVSLWICVPNNGTLLLNLKYTCDSFANHSLHLMPWWRTLILLTPELNSSEQCCLLRVFYWGFSILLLTLRGGKKRISHRLFLQI